MPIETHNAERLPLFLHPGPDPPADFFLNPFVDLATDFVRHRDPPCVKLQ